MGCAWITSLVWLRSFFSGLKASLGGEIRTSFHDPRWWQLGTYENLTEQNSIFRYGYCPFYVLWMVLRAPCRKCLPLIILSNSAFHARSVGSCFAPLIVGARSTLLSSYPHCSNAFSMQKESAAKLNNIWKQRRLLRIPSLFFDLSKFAVYV